MIFPDRGKNQRCDDANKNSTKGAAGRKCEIEGGQIAAWRFDARQFSVTNHASGEEQSEENGNLLENIYADIAEQSDYCEQRGDCEQGMKYPTQIPIASIECEDKAQQINA